MRNTRGVGLFAVCVLATLACACGHETASDPEPEPLVPVEVQLRFVHASPFTPALDVYLSGETAPLFQNVGYGDTTELKSVTTSRLNLEIRLSGSGASTAAIASMPTLFPKQGLKIDVVAAGLMDSGDPAAKLRLLPFGESGVAPPSGMRRLHIVHAGVDALPANVDVGEDDSIEVHSLARFNDASIIVPVGAQVGITAGVIPVPAFTLSEGPETLVVLTGLQRYQSLHLVGPDIVIQGPELYVLHSSPDVPLLDLFIGFRPLADGVDFGGMAHWFHPGPGPLGVYFHGQHRPPDRVGAGLMPFDGLEAGKTYLVLVERLEPDLLPDPRLIALDLASYGLEGRFAHEPDAAQLIVVNASTPTANAGVVSNGIFTIFPGGEDVYGDAPKWSLPVTLAPREHTFGVGDVDTSAVVTFDAATLPAGFEGFLILTGSGQGSGAEQRLLLVNTSVKPWTVTSIAPNASAPTPALSAELLPQVRFAHASPLTPRLDLYLQGSSTPLFASVAYGETTDFRPVVPVGSATLEIRLAGAAAGSPPLASIPAQSMRQRARVDAIAAGVMISGFMAGSDPATSLRLLATLERSRALPSDAIRRVHIVNAAAGTSSLGIDVGKDGNTEVPVLGRFAETTLDIPVASQIGMVANNGMAADFTVRAGPETFVTLSDLPGWPMPRLVGPDFNAQGPELYVLHVSPDLAPCDYFVDFRPVAAEVALGDLKHEANPGPGYLNWFPHGSNYTAGISFSSYNLVADSTESYLLYLECLPAPYLTPGSEGCAVIPGLLRLGGEFASFDHGPTDAQLWVVNESVPALDVGLVNHGVFTIFRVWDNPYGDGNPKWARITLAGGAYTFGVRDEEANAVFAFDATLPAGFEGFLFVTGSQLGAAPKVSRLLLVKTSVKPWTVTTLWPKAR